MKTLFFVLIFAALALSGSGQTPLFPAEGLRIRSQQISEAGDAKLVLANTSRQNFPSGKWRLYFNSPELKIVESDTVRAFAERVNGDMFRITPRARFPELRPGDSVVLRINLRRKNKTDSPSGFYLVWNSQPQKGYAVQDVRFLVPPYTEKREQALAEMTYLRNRAIQPVSASEQCPIFPTPAHYKLRGTDYTLKAGLHLAYDEKFRQEGESLAADLKVLTGSSPLVATEKETSELTIRHAGDLKKDEYKLRISNTGIRIEAGGNEGAWYATQSLKVLFPAAAWKAPQREITLPGLDVHDFPRFQHRAVMLDVARNFRSMKEVLKVIDLMSLYKLNILHFHLNDDEGWRLEIPALPELTAVGAFRPHTSEDKAAIFPSYGSGPDSGNTNGNGFYTRTEFVNMLRYARERHIRVIPEIETPGHARAAIKAMDSRYDKLKKEGKDQEAEAYLLREPEDRSVYRSVQGWDDNVINVALPSVYRFLETVTDEISGMYKEAGAELETIHMGGDEVPSGVWTQSPAVKELMKQQPTIRTPEDLWYYYFGKVDTLLKKRGLFLSGWEEIALRKTEQNGKKLTVPNADFLNRNFQADVWANMPGSENADLPYRLANAGYKVLLTCVTNFYFDLASSPSYYEPGQYWGGYVDVEKPFYFVPFDYYKTMKEDEDGNPLPKNSFEGKEKLTEQGKANILGLQAPLWSEVIKSDTLFEYMLLPKLYGLAERAWAPDPAWATEPDSIKARTLYQKAWSGFLAALGTKELPRLDYLAGGFHYRIPPPGAIVRNKTVTANVQIPGMQIRYTTDGSEPTLKSPLYTKPFSARGTVILRTFGPSGRAGNSVRLKL